MEKIKLRAVTAVLALIFALTSVPESAAVAAANCAPIPDRSLRFDPPVSDHAIQTFDNGAGTDVYFVQRSQRNTWLSRCSRSDDGTCIQRDRVELKGYGHGESLEVYTENGRTYAWVGSGAREKAPSYHAKRISLIEYIKAPEGSTQASYRRIGTLTNLAAIAPGQSGPAVRSAVALADDANRLAIRVRLRGQKSTSYYGVYETAALTALLKKAPGRRLSIAKAQKLLVSQFAIHGSPNSSFQGFDIDAVGTELKSLYVFGGNKGQDPTVYRYTWQGADKVTHDQTYVLQGDSFSGLEAEGVKVETDPTSNGSIRVQIGLKTDERDGDDRRVFRLYRFSENSPECLPPRDGDRVLPPSEAADGLHFCPRMHCYLPVSITRHLDDGSAPTETGWGAHEGQRRLDALHALAPWTPG